MYLRLKFTSTANYLNTTVSSKAISLWIKEALDGTTAVSALPAAAFDISNCVRLGSLPSEITVQSSVSTSTNATTFINENWFQFTKAHSQNANFTSLFRIHQGSSYNVGWQPRLLSSNSTNMVPTSVSTSVYWYDSNSATYFTHGVSNCEMQFFISSHWVIWSIIDGSGRGGTAGIYDVESTGQDVWARSLNSLYSPQVFITSHGGSWPSSSTSRFSEVDAQRNIVGIHSNLMYNGDGTFTNAGTQHRGVYDYSRGSGNPMLYPDPFSTFFSTRDNIGDTQNYMMPVYFYAQNHTSSTVPASRRLLNGRIPFLWRTSDMAAQTGQAATVSGTEYRFVRLHACGSAALTDNNAAVYMVPTTIGGV